MGFLELISSSILLLELLKSFSDFRFDGSTGTSLDLGGEFRCGDGLFTWESMSAGACSS